MFYEIEYEGMGWGGGIGVGRSLVGGDGRKAVWRCEGVGLGRWDWDRFCSECGCGSSTCGVNLCLAVRIRTLMGWEGRLQVLVYGSAMD